MDRLIWSDKLIVRIHPISVQEIGFTPGLDIDTDTNILQDRMGCGYREFLDEKCMPMRLFCGELAQKTLGVPNVLASNIKSYAV